MPIKNEIGAIRWSFLDWLWIRQNAECQRYNHCTKEKMPVPAAALTIDEEEQRKLDEAEEQEKANPLKDDTKESVGQGMVDQKNRVWTV